MPNIYVLGLDPEEARLFSRLATDVFARELDTPREHVSVFRQEATVFRDGADAPLPIIIRISWIRRPAEHFTRAVEGLTRAVRDGLGRRRDSVQVELHEKWHDGAIDGRLCSQWAAANRERPS